LSGQESHLLMNRVKISRMSSLILDN